MSSLNQKTYTQAELDEHLARLERELNSNKNASKRHLPPEEKKKAAVTKARETKLRNKQAKLDAENAEKEYNAKLQNEREQTVLNMLNSTPLHVVVSNLIDRIISLEESRYKLENPDSFW